MALAEIVNITPQETIQEMLDLGKLSPEESAFALGSFFSADVSLKFGVSKFTFAGVRFFPFARDLMQLAFDLSFDEVVRLQMETLHPNKFLLTVEVEGELIALHIDVGSSASAALDGETYVSGERISSYMNVLEFNRTCGAFFKLALTKLDDIYEGIDGVQEFFGDIYFSRMFPEAWELDD